MLRLMSHENLCTRVGGVTLDPLEHRATLREGAWGSACPDPPLSAPSAAASALGVCFLPRPHGVLGCVEVLALDRKSVV